MTTGPRDIRALLRALRRVRVGEAATLPPCPAPLAPRGHDADRLSVADACRGIAAALQDHVEDGRAVDACIRFHGLGRLPEGLDAIAASTPSAADRHDRLRWRRVRQLIEGAEARLAAVAAGAERHHPVEPVDDRAVDRVFGQGRPAPEVLGVLMRAWADVPDGDHRSATALLLAEQEAGLRAPLVTGLHREARRRLRRRARAILAVAEDRYAAARRVAPGAGRRPDLASDLLLGPRHLVVVGGGAEAFDAVLRVAPGRAGVDGDALLAASAHVRELVRRRAPEAPAALGILRAAIADPRNRVPPVVVVRTLAQATIAAREDDDPAGVLPADEARRVAAVALRATASARAHRAELTGSVLRALQEVAELHARLWRFDAARGALADAVALLDELGDPEADVEPDGWLQQLRYSESLVERRASLVRRDRATVGAAYRAADDAVRIAVGRPELPVDRGLTAAAVLAQVATDAAVRSAAEAGPGGRAPAVAHARRLVDANESGWVAHGPGGSATGRSARLLSAVNACRLALVARDRDAFRWHRGRLVRLVDTASLQADAEELRALDGAAAAAGMTSRHEPRLADLARTAPAAARAAAGARPSPPA